MEDSKQESRKQFKYIRDLVEENRKPEEERKLLLALPMTYTQCTEMNVDDHAATDKDVAFKVVDITLEDDSNAWQEAAKAYGDPFSIDDIKDVVIDCYDPSTDPCVLTASCNPDKVYQEAVATVIFHASMTKSAYDNVFTEVAAAANEGRLLVAVSTAGGTVTAGNMLWATSRYRFKQKLRGCCHPGVTPIAVLNLDADETDTCEEDCLANADCTAFELLTGANNRYMCEHHSGIVTEVYLASASCRVSICGWDKIYF